MEENENNSMRSHEVQNSQDTSEQNNNNDDMEESDDQSQEEETNKFFNLISKVQLWCVYTSYVVCSLMTTSTHLTLIFETGL